LLAGFQVRAQSTNKSAQTQSTNDPAQALAEIRALRAEVKEFTEVAFRAQVLLARLQLQEHRLLGLERARAELATRIKDTDATRSALAAQVQSIDAQRRFLFGGSKATESPIDGVRHSAMAELRQMEVAAAQLQAEAASLDGAASVEQGRWTELNSRLEEIEKTVRKRPY
jgi:chromosome segregation ATPase